MPAPRSTFDAADAGPFDVLTPEPPSQDLADLSLLSELDGLMSGATPDEYEDTNVSTAALTLAAQPADETAFDSPVFGESIPGEPANDGSAVAGLVGQDPPSLSAVEADSGIPAALLGGGLPMPYEDPSALSLEHEEPVPAPSTESLRTDLLIQESAESEKPAPEPVGTTRRSFQGVVACAVFAMALLIIVSGGKATPDVAAAPSALALSIESVSPQLVPPGTTGRSQNFAELDEGLSLLPEPAELFYVESDTGSVLVFGYEAADGAVSAVAALESQGYELSAEQWVGPDHTATRSGRFVLVYAGDSNRTFVALVTEHVRLL